MCVIVYKPKGVAMPTKAVLKNCFEHNRDGAGIMWNDGKHVIIEKGFYTLKGLIEAINLIPNANEKDVVIHCRIATHGRITGANCHPFPVTVKRERLKNLQEKSNLGLAHNGTIHFCVPTKKDNDYSDSQLFIADYLSACTDVTSMDVVLSVMSQTTTNKFALMTPKFVCIYGKFTQNKGIFYSNDSFMAYKRFSSYSTNAANNTKWWDEMGGELAWNEDFPSDSTALDKAKEGKIITLAK